MSRLDRQGGFTLIEVLVALTVMGLGLGAISQLYGTVFEGNARAEKTTQALLIAESKLTEYTIDAYLTAGRKSGETKDGFRWIAEIAELAESAATSPVRAFTVTVTVSRGSSPPLTLQTLRLRAQRRGEERQ